MEKSPNKKLSAAGLAGALRRHKLYLLIPMVIFAAGAWMYARRMPQNYRARVEISAEPVVPANYLSDRPAVAPVLNVQDQLRSIRDVLLSPVMLSRVIGDLGMYDVARGGGMQPAVDEMKSKLQIQVDSPDSFFVSFEGPRALETMEAVNRLAEGFVARTSSLLGQRTQQVDNFLDTEVAQLRRQLDQQEQGLAGYKQSVSQALPDRVATSLKHVETVQQEIQSETDHIGEAQARRSAVAEELKTLEKQGALQPEPAAKTTTDAALDDARNRLRQLRARYTAQNPSIAQADKEVKDLEAAVAAQTKVSRPPSANQMQYYALQAELKSIDERVKSYGQERDTLTAELQQAERQVDSSPGYASAVDRLSRDAAVTRSRYEALLARQQEAKLDQRAGQAGNGILYKIVEPASLPAKPSGPKPYQIVLVGLIAGLGLGLGAILIREQMDSSFGTVEEFEGYTDLPVLAAVPTISNRPIRMGRSSKVNGTKPRLVAVDQANVEVSALDQKHLKKHRLTVASDPHSVPSEQYRILAVKVAQWIRQDAQNGLAKAPDDGKVLAVTSAAGGEGKSVTALNLSLALASSTRGPVLLIDADLWRPRVSEYLGLKSSRGISDLLAEPEMDLDSCIAKVGNLDVISGGTLLSNPVGLLASGHARQLLQQLRQRYRLIVLDSPPIVPAADSHVLAGLADGVVVVVRARQTKRELFRRALESLGANNVLGVVLNDVNYGDTNYAYAYRYYQRECVGGR
jgi:polysaccharide chain length determinant protein (PEP-CTERM system associated)